MADSGGSVARVTQPALRVVRDGDALENIEPAELTKIARPLLRAAWSGMPDHVRRHHEDNVPGALAELWDSYKRDGGLLDARRVEFPEFYAAKLASKLKELDRRQRPELYDEHGYHPDREPVSLEEVRPEVPVDREPASLERLVAMLRESNKEPASQNALIRALGAVRSGSAPNPRQFAKALGHADYRHRPASQAYAPAVEIADSVDATSADADAGFRVVLDPSAIL